MGWTNPGKRQAFPPYLLTVRTMQHAAHFLALISCPMRILLYPYQSKWDSATKLINYQLNRSTINSLNSFSDWISLGDNTVIKWSSISNDCQKIIVKYRWKECAEEASSRIDCCHQKGIKFFYQVNRNYIKWNRMDVLLYWVNPGLNWTTIRVRIQNLNQLKTKSKLELNKYKTWCSI